MDLWYIILLPLIVVFDCCTCGLTGVLLKALDILIHCSPERVKRVEDELQSTASSRCRRALRLVGANSNGATMALFAPPSVARKPLLPAEVNAVKQKILVTGATGYIGAIEAMRWCADKARSGSCCAGLATADMVFTSLLHLAYR